MNNINIHKKSIGGLILSVMVGLMAGSYLTKLFSMLPDNVVKQFFTKSISFGFGFPESIVFDLSAMKLKLGFSCEFTLLSLVGIAITVYIFRWYK
jgi:hypothetical protein